MEGIFSVSRKIIRGNKDFEEETIQLPHGKTKNLNGKVGVSMNRGVSFNTSLGN